MDVQQRLHSSFKIDQTAIEMALLFAVVLAIASFVSFPLTESAETVTPPDSFGEGATGETTAAMTWAIAEVIFAVVVLGIAYLVRRAPDWMATLIKRNVVIVTLLFFGASVYGTTDPVSMFAATWLVVGGGYSLYYLADTAGVWWVLNNGLSVVMAVVAGVALGMLFGPVGLGAAALILTVYDHYFANEKKYMFELGALIVKYRLPVLFIRPDVFRFQWSEVVDDFNMATEDSDIEMDAEQSWGIGTADMMIPAGIVSGVISSSGAVITTFGLVAVGILIAGVVVACFRLRREMQTQGSGAGLPALSTGVLVPYLALLVVSSLA